MPQAGRTAAQRQSSNAALVFRVDDDGPMRWLTALRVSSIFQQTVLKGCSKGLL
jgi:hypothetical protein